MAKDPPAKERKGSAPSDKISTDKSLVGDGVVNSSQAHICAKSAQIPKRGNGSGEVALIEKLSTKSIPAGDGVERQSKISGRGLQPVSYKNTIRTSYVQPAASPRQIRLQEQRQDESHRIHVFSSQKLPQPFLDR